MARSAEGSREAGRGAAVQSGRLHRSGRRKPPPSTARGFGPFLPAPHAAPAAWMRLAALPMALARPSARLANGQLVELKQQRVHSGVPTLQGCPAIWARTAVGLNTQPLSFARLAAMAGAGQMQGVRRKPASPPTRARLEEPARKPIAAIGSQGIPLGSWTIGLGRGIGKNIGPSGAGGAPLKVSNLL